ncbi:MAG: YgaP family membrane protein [Bacteroidota bacterium]
MKKNMGTIDRMLRTLLALLVGVLYYQDIISGTVAIVLGILAIVFLLTSMISTCPLYMPFGLSTRKEN